MALLFLSFVGYCLAWVIYTRWFHSLAKYPGPFMASITRLWLVVDVARGKSEETQRRLHRIYGLSKVHMREHCAADKGRPYRANRAGRSRYSRSGGDQNHLCSSLRLYQGGRVRFHTMLQAILITRRLTSTSLSVRHGADTRTPSRT